MTLLELSKAHNWNLPIVCPVCGKDLILNDSGFPECINEKCDAKIEHQFMRFFNILDIKAAGPAFIKALTKDARDKENSFSFLLSVTTNDDVNLFNQWAGGINGEKILTQMKPYFWVFAKKDKPKAITTAQYLAMFDYPSLSTKQFEKIKDLSINNFMNYTYNELNNIEGIGDELASKILKFRDEYKNRIELLFRYFNIEDKKETTESSDLPTICFTGACPGYSRKELTDLCSKKYNVVTSVTKDTQFLACEDPNSGSSKLQKAMKNGTKIISYEELLKNIE